MPPQACQVRRLIDLPQRSPSQLQSISPTPIPRIERSYCHSLPETHAVAASRCRHQPPAGSSRAATRPRGSELAWCAWDATRRRSSATCSDETTPSAPTVSQARWSVVSGPPSVAVATGIPRVHGHPRYLQYLKDRQHHHHRPTTATTREPVCVRPQRVPRCTRAPGFRSTIDSPRRRHIQDITLVGITCIPWRLWILTPTRRPRLFA